MAHVVDTTYGRNRDLGQVTDPVLLAYYAGLGYTIDGSTTGTVAGPPVQTVTGLQVPFGATDGEVITVQSGGFITAPPASSPGGGSGGASLTPTGVKTANYTLAIGDLAPFDCTAAGRTATLPTGATAGQACAVKKLDTSNNALTVAAGGSDLIVTASSSGTLTTVGTASFTIQETRTYVSNGAGRWFILSGNIPLSVLQTLFAPAGNYVSASPAPSAWQAGHAYTVGQSFTQAGTTYVVATPYTSGGTFGSTDTTNAFTFGGGSTGTAATPQGAWSSITTYATNDVVTYNGGTYRAKAASTNVIPGNDATKWEQWAAPLTSAVKGLRNYGLGFPMCRSSLSGSAPASLIFQSNGTDTAGMYCVRIDLSGYLGSSFRLAYMNSLTNPITVKAGVDRQNGGLAVGVTFNGGASSVTIPVNGFAVSDPVYINNVVLAGMYGISTTPPFTRPALSGNPYSFINARTYVTVTAGQKWPLNIACGLSGDGAESGTSITDKTASGTVTAAGAGAYAYGPAMVLTDVPNALPIILGIGDSILNGTGDTSGNTGFFDRAMRANRGALHSLRYGAPGTIPGYLNATTGGSVSIAQAALTALPGVTHCIYASGVNYFYQAGATVLTTSQMNSNKQGLWNDWMMLNDMGIKVYACTIQPYTTSTDSWATTTNQTPSANEANRVDLNAYIRSMPSPLAGYFELADVVESARDSGRWKANYTADGLHPNATGHAAAATGITTAMFA